MNKQTIYDIDVAGKTVYVRVDYNVPCDKDGHITDDRRIRSTLPTIRYLLKEGAAVILASHMGRPKGERNPELSLRPAAERLSELLEQPVQFADDCIGSETAAMKKALQPGQVLLLENLRFHKEEEKNDPDFAKALVEGCTAAVNDAFGVCHRAHASVEAITKFYDEKHKAAGFLLQKEINFAQNLIKHPSRPFVAVVGGSKVSGKLQALHNLLPRVDKLIIGGGMAFTFLKSLGENIGNSLLEEELIEDARQILQKGKELGVKIYLPVDVVAAQTFSAESAVKYVPAQEIPNGWMGLDIGPASVRLFKEVLADAQTVWWNGPMGVFEMDKFSKGSIKMSHAIIDTHATTVVGGGDTADVVERAGDADEMTFISTGGGASLELIEGKELPGIKPLRKEE